MRKILLAFVLLALLAEPSLGAEDAAGKASPSSPPAEIVLTGKFFCSLKRRVPLPFKGIITSVRLQSGQQVEEGEILATYRLSPEAALQVSRRLAPAQINDLEVKLSEVQKNLDELQAKQKGLLLLAEKELASPLSLTQADREAKMLTQQKQMLLESLRQEKLVAQEDRGLLRSQLGKSINRGRLPATACLRAPISGYIIWVHPDLRQGAELEPTEAVLQIGVMDPMVLRAQVHEIEAMQLLPGDQAEVILDSLPGRKVNARVSRVSWAPTNVTLDQPTYYHVEFSAANPDLLLKEGLKGTIIMRKSK